MKRKLTLFQKSWLYFFVHFSLEVACFYFLYSRVYPTLFWGLFALLYDSVAFALQGVFGIWLDKHPSVPLGGIGCVFVALALFTPVRILAVLFIGVGNAFVHIDGAQHTLRDSNSKLTPNALFVGGGSFGVITGQLLGVLGIKPLIFLPLFLILSCVFVCIVITKNTFPDKQSIESSALPLFDKDNKKLPDGVFVFLVVFTVAVRSYIGYAIPISWNKSIWQAILLFSAMGIGKILGGISADLLGFRKTAYISLGFALPFLLFGDSLMLLSLLGVTLFSMTMPLSVGLLCSRFPTTPAFAFGLTTLGLFFGIAPAFFIVLPSLLAHQITVLFLSVSALICFIITTKKEKGA